MIVLGIETSTAVCSVGLFEDGTGGIEQSITESHIHSEKLLTLVQGVVSQKKISLNDIDAVAVSIGPGSFTGLRIGLSTAKGLCYALERSLVTVPTFEAIAESVAESRSGVQKILIMLDAKKDELYVGRFEVSNAGAVSDAGSVEVVPSADIIARMTTEASALVVTDRVEAMRGKAPGDRLMDVHQFCKASVVARIGYRKVLSKEFADIASVEPLYLKDFIIRTAAPTTSG